MFNFGESGKGAVQPIRGRDSYSVETHIVLLLQIPTLVPIISGTALHKWVHEQAPRTEGALLKSHKGEATEQGLLV